MNKLGTALGCLLMLGAAIAPGVFAHGDAGVHTPPWVGGAAAGVGSVKPAGWYYGSASAWAQLNAFSAGSVGPNIVPGCPTPTSVPQVDTLLCSLVIDADPSFTLAAADALCDVEVGGDGSGPLPADEKWVDGRSGPAAGDALPNAGALPDGTFNDGGIGAICHTHSGFYGFGAYNTPGCPAGTAKAEDAVVGGSVFITATCDSIRPVATSGLLTQVLSAETCAANEVLSGNPTGVLGCVQRFIDCSPAGAIGACPATGATACVPDGVADASASGTGNPGVPYPGIDASCPAGTDAAQATFVWNSVQVTVTSGGVVTPNVESVATYGYVK